MQDFGSWVGWEQLAFSQAGRSSEQTQHNDDKNRRKKQRTSTRQQHLFPVRCCLPCRHVVSYLGAGAAPSLFSPPPLDCIHMHASTNQHQHQAHDTTARSLAPSSVSTPRRSTVQPSPLSQHSTAQHSTPQSEDVKRSSSSSIQRPPPFIQFKCDTAARRHGACVDFLDCLKIENRKSKITKVTVLEYLVQYAGTVGVMKVGIE